MKTLQRFSSSLGNQIKELGVKVSSKDVWGKGSLDDTTEKEGREFFSSRILGSVHAGEILFETDSLFHDLILQIEDATIHLLLQHFNLEDLPQASSAFASRAAQFGEFDLMDSIYCTSQIGVIRSSIRRMVCHNRSRLREQLDAIFLNISSSYDKNISINGIPGVQLLLNQLSGEASADKPISYSILSDESFTSTIHLKISSNCSDDTKSSKHQRPSRERIPIVSVVVAGSGSEQVHGVYTQIQEKNLDGSSASSLTFSYSSCEGYLITRKMKRILLRSNAEEILTGDISLNRKDRACELKSLELVVATEGENQSVEAQENKACLSDLTVYQWILSNPSLASCYYTCCTLDPTSLPPALGWRPSGSLCQGKMPGPQLTMSDNVDNDSDYSDSDNTAIDTHVPTETNSNKSPVAKKKEMMRKSERRKMNGKNRKCATDTVGAPMLTLDFFSTESLGVTSCRSACRSVTSNGKLLKRIVVPSIARIYVSPFSRKISNCQMMCSAGLIVEDETVSSSSCNKKSHIFNYCPLTTDWNGMISKDLDDICKKKLLKLVHDCSAEEASLVFNIERTKERVGWLSKVTDIDELLLGPGLDTAAPMDDPSNDSGIEYFASQWGLEEILKKKSQTDSVMLAPGCATSLVEIASTHSKDQFAVGIGDQTCLLDGVKAVSVRKATSMPIIGSSVRTEERTESPCHRRSQSQSQSVYQWPVDFNSYSRDDESEEDHLCAVDLKSMRNQNEGRQTFDSNMESSKTHKLCNSSDTENLPKPKISKSKSLNDALKSNGLERSSPRTGVEEVILSLELDLTDRKLLKTIGRKSTQYLSELQDLATPLDRQCYSYANVDVIGVELRGSSLECGSNMSTSSPSVHTVEKAHYVIRVSLRECTEPKVTHSPAGLQKVCNLRTSTATVDACNTDRNAMFRESIGESRDISSVPAEYRNHSAMSYSSDLPPILAVEENINNGFSQSQQPRSTAGIKSQHSYSRRVFTVKRDFTSISLFHARICNILQSHSRTSISPPLFPDPFRIAAIEEEMIESSAVKRVSSFSVKMMQTKLDGKSFGYSSAMRDMNGNVKGKESLGSKELDEVLDSIQVYFRGIFSLIEKIDPELSTHENTGQHADSSLLQKLGSLVGSFLTNKDREEKILNNFHDLEEITKPSSLPDSNVDVAPLPPSTSIFLTDLSVDGTPLSSKNITSPLFTENDDEGRNISKTSACWQPYVRGGLKTRLTFTDDHGGRLSLKSDDELLRAQRSLCMGCGEQLSVQWGFLGLDRNYQPCRYYGGLFCRKWCHSGDRRPIPNRLLLYWDHKAHRVSIQAARFLDELWKKPLIHLKTANRLLYEGVPTLRLARNMRGRALSLIERVLESDLSDDKSTVKDAIINTLGLQQIHLCLSSEIYSLSDLVRVQSGEALAAIELLIGVLREKDYSLSIHSGPSHRQPSSLSKV